MYGIHTNAGYIRSAVIQRILSDRLPDHPETMGHLSAIEHLEARGMKYANQDQDVLSAAIGFLRREAGCQDQPLDRPGFALRVAVLEASGHTTSDAQGIADAEMFAVVI